MTETNGGNRPESDDTLENDTENPKGEPPAGVGENDLDIEKLNPSGEDEGAEAMDSKKDDGDEDDDGDDETDEDDETRAGKDGDDDAA
jgi:hypothetical protein